MKIVLVTAIRCSDESASHEIPDVHECAVDHRLASGRTNSPPLAGLSRLFRQAFQFIAVFLFSQAVKGVDLCRINVVEDGSGWPAPLVELRTTHNARLVSDNAGVIAFDLAELMGTKSWFFVEGHGYEVPQDGFGNRGVRLKPMPGKRLTY